MLVYRVFPYLPTAKAGFPGHPRYEHHPQRGGRIDHPDYYVWYLARQAEAAVGESFGNLASWERSMFDVPFLPRARRALGVFRLPDDLRVCDLDDPHRLSALALRPTQIVTRNLAVTQEWGHAIWAHPDPHDPREQLWQSVQWWSYHHPSWTVVASWVRPEVVRVEPLDLSHGALRDAATALHRPIR